jgi:hypothetical protein
MPWNYLEPHQSRQGQPSAYEVKLAGAIEEIFGRRTHDLPGLLAELNSAGLTAPDGRPWAEESFTAEMHRLGA